MRMSTAKAKKSNKIQLSVGTKVAMWVAFAIFVIYGITLLFPLLWVYCLVLQVL
jgi:hypothetical protein